METLTFPKSLVTLGEGAFQGCLALQEVTVPSAIGIIPARAFDACIRLERVEVFRNPEQEDAVQSEK